MKSRALMWAGVALLGVALAGCAKKKVAAAPPPPAPAAAQQAAVTPVRPNPPVQPGEPYRAPLSPSRMPDTATRMKIQDLIDRIQDAYFDYDKHTLRPDAVAALQTDAKTLGEILRQYPDFKLTVEGYCDERGSAEYNLALGDARAKQAKDFLAQLGIPASQLQAVSFGKERQVCGEHDETCWQKNRRAHIARVI